MDYKLLISNSKSVREYKKISVKEDVLKKMADFAKTCRKLDAGISTEVLFLDNSKVFYRLENVAGYNGRMVEAPNYIVILSEENENAVENAGYIGEELILKAVELGIDSCWITFADGRKIVERLELETEKTVVALIALGYEDASGKSKVINPTKTGENYSKSSMEIVKEQSAYRLELPEIVFMKEWGNKANVDELEERGLLDAFYYTRLAPSTLNRQPWRFIVNDGEVVLAVRNDEYTNSYEKKIDAGIVMQHFQAVVGATLVEINWKMGSSNNNYNVDEAFRIVGYCKI